MIKILFLFLLLPLNILAKTKEIALLRPETGSYLHLNTIAFSKNKQTVSGIQPGHYPAINLNPASDSLIQSQADTSKEKYLPGIIHKAAFPVILIGLGFAGSGKKPLLGYNEEIQEEIQEHYNGFHTKIDNYTQYAPIAVAYGLNIAGIKGRHNLVNLTCLYVLSDFISSATTKQLKSLTREMRPDQSTADGFPSGHTTRAFTSATVLFLEYKDKNIWYGIGGYSFAVGTGALRMLNNKHWFSDVLAGAGIGILSTQVAYTVYPWIQKQISKQIPRLANKNLLITPTYANSSLGFGMVYQLR